MCSRKSGANIIDIIGFTAPKLHEGKQTYIDFMAIDPETGKPKRKKYYISGHTKKETRQIAARLINTITIKLSQGWSPWASSDSPRGARLLTDVIEQYTKQFAYGHRKKSILSYTSRANILNEYLHTLRLPAIYVANFDKTLITDFLDWLIQTRSVTARTRNNYLGWLSSLSQYMVERGYLQSNPCASIRKMKQDPKKRLPLTHTMLRQLFSHLQRHDPPFLLATMMEYYTFIRPNELTHIHIGDISLKEMSVYIPAEISKNKKDGKVALNEEIIHLMLDLQTFNANSDMYLFGANLLPSYNKVSPDIFNKRFAKIRKILKWTDEYKFYSLKDSGIRDLTNAKGIVAARDQARHADITTTNIYIGHESLQAPESPKHFKGYLSSPEQSPGTSPEQSPGTSPEQSPGTSPE